MTGRVLKLMGCDDNVMDENLRLEKGMAATTDEPFNIGDEGTGS